MKLIIQIPCFNEADQLPLTLADLPREVTGFDAVEWLVIDDGSTDETIAVARKQGVEHIVPLTNNKGLAAGFQAGIDLPEARRGRDRQHRRRQPVLRPGRRAAGARRSSRGARTWSSAIAR